MDTADETAERHVNRSCEKGRCNEDKDALKDVDREVSCLTVGDNTTNVADQFNCNRK